MLFSASKNNGYLFSTLWIDDVRDKDVAHSDTDKVKQLDVISKKVNHMNADDGRMQADVKAAADAKGSTRKASLVVEQAEARARVTRRAEAEPYTQV
jgi:hypothetical protein